MKNFAKYICLFLTIVGINISALAGDVTITNHLTGCAAKAGQQTTITDAQQASNVELLYTIDNGYTGDPMPTISVALEYPATHVSTTLPTYCYRWERQQDNVYGLRLFASAINGSAIGGYKDRDVKISIVCQTGAQKYSLIYDANGGISECSDGEYAAGAVTLCSTPPTRDGYSFTGWKASNGSTYAAGASFTMPEKDETLVAQWSGNQVTITLNGNADGVANGTAHVRMGATTLEDFARVSKDGATILGYYTAARGGRRVITPEGALVANVPGYTDKSGRWIYATSPLVLYTQYKYDNYQTYCPRVVTFENNGQTTAVMPSPQSGKKGFTVVEPVTIPTVSTGYTFSHWSTTTDGDAYNFATPVTIDFPLYAIWDANAYTITYTLNYGTNHLSNPTRYTVEDLPITLNDPSRTGYDFQGWFNNKDFSGSAFTNIAVGTTGDLKFWAKWQAHVYNVNYQMNGGTNNSGNITSYPYASSGSFTLLDPISAPTGYHFDKWTKAGGSTKVTTIQYNVAADQTFVANWLPNQYTVTFDKQGGADGSNNVTATYDAAMPAATVPNKTGYTFGGYYTETEGNGTKYYNADGTSAHVWDIDANPTTLYAKWTANTHTLTWDFDGGSCSGTVGADYTAGGSVEYGALITAPEDNTMSKTGYTFAGWSGYSASMPNADLTITAQWTANTYQVSYNGNGNTGGSMANTDFTYDVAKPLRSNAYSKLGYTFAGWALTEDGDVAYNDQQSVLNLTNIPGAVVELFAKWNPKTVNITWDAATNGGTIEGNDTKVTSYTYDGASVELPTPDPKAGYTFTGWWTTAGGGSQVTEVGTTNKPTTDQTYYAKWTQSTFNLTCKKKIYGEDPDQCGDVQPISAGTSNVEVVLNESCLPDGYHVIDWEVSPSTAIVKDVENRMVTITTMPSNDVTVTAVLAPNLTVTGDVKLVGANGSPIITVGTALNAISISCTDMSKANQVRISYNDGTTTYTGATKTSSAFRLADDSYNYGSTDGGTNVYLSTAGWSNTKTFAMVYNAKTPGVTDNYTMTVELMNGSTVLDTKSITMVGRRLPNKFVIATKYNDNWYALPNDMPSEGLYDVVPIVVNGEGEAIAPKNTIYSMATYTSTDKQAVRFVTETTGLWGATGSNNGVRDYSKTENSSNYGWVVTATDWENGIYTMSPRSNTRNINVYNMKWGMNGTVHTDAIQFLPIASEIEVAKIHVREWKADGVVFAYNDNGVSASATYYLGQNAAADAGLVKHSTGGYALYEISTCDLTDKAGQVLNIVMADSKVASVSVPIIVNTNKSTNTSEPFATLGAKTASYDVVVLGGKTLTTNAIASGACKFNTMYIYPGATLVNAENGNLSLYELELRGGIKGIAAKDSKEQAVPYVYLGKAISTCTNAYLDMAVDVTHDYAVSVPFEVNLENVNYTGAWNKSSGAPMVGTIGSQFRITRYNTALRASSGTGWEDITSGTMTPGVGYVMQAKRPSGQPYAVIRFPLNKVTGVASWADNTNGEVEKAAVALSNAGCGDDNVTDNNKGWNMLSDPFLAKVSHAGSDPDAIVGSLVKSMLEKHLDEHGNWTGTYDWVTDSDNRTWLSVPNDVFTEYSQVRASAHIFEPCKVFFVQATTAGTVSFARGDRKQSAPTRALMVEENTEPVIADFVLSHDNKQTYAGLTIDEQATAGYKLGEDQVLFETRSAVTYLKTCMVVEGNYVVGNTLQPSEAEQLIPVEIYAPDMQTDYTFSIDETSDLDRIESMMLYDYETGFATDLMSNSYEFTVGATGWLSNRFALNVTLLKNAPQTPTDIGGGGETGGRDVRKVIFNDKLYIIVEGKVYDATGKTVK